MTTLAEHEIYRSESRQAYLDNRNAHSDALDWRQAQWEARRSIIRFLRASNFLFDVAGALRQSGYHSFPMRHFLAPPISQDQFKLLCNDWSKSSEKSGMPLTLAKSHSVSAVFAERRSKHLTAWIDRARGPRLMELASAIGAIAPLMASQQVATARRNRFAAMQEKAVLDTLTARGWTRLQSGPVLTAGQLPAKHYMHKTRFASGVGQTQEVDVACGLGATIVLAMECKVTNDETNSVKRVDDVLKKAQAWKSHWAYFVKPAALLQGVIKASDVQRLIDGGVEVFWSHRLDLFNNWIDANES